jgi:hypothetical protein
VSTLLSSPRRRRRFAWGCGLVAITAGLVTVGLLWPNTAEQRPEVREPGKAQVYHEPQHVKLTHKARAQALTTAANFVKTAVARQNVERSWPLVSASLKQGYTLTEWKRGTIPVVPYPVASAKWKLDYVYADALGLQVLVFPREGTGERPNLFFMELKPTGDASHRHWVVDSWTPSGVANPALAAPVPSGGGGGNNALGVQSLDTAVVGQGQSRLGAAWLLLPIGLLAIVPIVLLLFGLRSWRRSRRAERAYREHAQRRAGVTPPGSSAS